MTFRNFFAVLFTAVLTACSSGGGSGGGPGSGPTGSVSISDDSLRFSANINDGAAGIQTITGSIANPDSDVFLFLDLGVNPLFADWSYNITGNQATFFLDPRPPQELGAGAHTGQIEIRVCRDQNCASQYSGSPVTVNVAYEIFGTSFALSGNQLNFTYVAGSALPDTQSITMTPNGPWANYGWTYSDYPRDPDWIKVTDSQSQSGNGVVTYQFALNKPLPPGEYSTSIGLFFDGAALAQPVDINVTVLDPAFLVNDNLVDFHHTTSTELSTLQQTITVSEASYGQRDWNISTEADWLDISQNSGNTTNNNRFTVSANANALVLPTGYYQAWINLSDSVGAYGDVRILVRLAKDFSSQPQPEIGCLEDAGVIFIDCQSNEWNRFTVWEMRADNAMFHYQEPSPEFLVDWSTTDADGRGKVIDVQYGLFDSRAMLRVYTKGKPRDLSHFAGGTVEFDLRVLNWGSTVNGLEFKLECIWPCESAAFPLNIPNLNQWYHFSFDVNELQNSGLDLSTVDIGFQVSPAWEGGSMNGVHFQLDNIRWNP